MKSHFEKNPQTSPENLQLNLVNFNWPPVFKTRNLPAETIVRELAKEINGGGGGQAFYATAGGSNAAGMKAAMEKAKAY